MDNEINFQDENHLSDDLRKDWSHTQWVDEFYQFLQGDVPKGITIGHGHQPKMSHKKAMTIIWYLQEHLRVLPDHIEQCSSCANLFDSHSEGTYFEPKGHFCDGCLI